jgi:hypothetical protein
MNGLLRQYMLKGTDLSAYSQQELDAIAEEINFRPKGARVTMSTGCVSRASSQCQTALNFHQLETSHYTSLLNPSLLIFNTQILNKK